MENNDETENTFDGLHLHYYHFADRIGRSGNSRIISDTDKGDSEKLWSGGIGYPGVLSNSLQLMSRYTKTEYDEICKQAKTDPEKLESVSYLEEVNTKLQEKSSYLIFAKTEFWFTMDIMEIQASVTSSGKNSFLPMARVTAARVRHIMWTMMRSRC